MMDRCVEPRPRAGRDRRARWEERSMFTRILEDGRGVAAVLFHGDDAGRGGPSDELRRSQDRGWNGCLDELGRVLAER